MFRFLTVVILAFSQFAIAHGDDWPQWLGPNRDSVYRESDVIAQIPADGLPVKWRTPVGLGYSGPAVADGRVFVADFQLADGKATNNPGARDKLQGLERIVALDAATGNQLWKHEYPQTYEISYPGGPRATPTVHEGKVYALGAEGKFVCLDAGSGDVIWQTDFPADYETKTPIWGYSAHPLIVDDLVYAIVGGKGSVVVAFDKNTGRERWKALSAPEPGYCPPTLIEHGGTRQLLVWHPLALNSLNPITGEAYWSLPLKPDYAMAIAAPRLHEDLLFASGIGNVGALFRLGSDPPSAEVVWRGTPKTAVYAANTTPMIDGEMIYGCDCRSGALMGVRLADGERLWETFKPTTGGDRRAGHGTAFLVKHLDRYFLFSETGDLILARLSPSGYEELGRFHVLEPTNSAFGRPVVWSHPAFAQRCLFARNDKEVVCVDLAAPK